MLIGKEAYDFIASAVMPNNSIANTFNLYDHIKDRKAVLFFYPLDFTFVCPSEIIAIDNKIAEFEKRKVTVILISVDSIFSHLAYKNTSVDKGGIGNIKVPMVSDMTKKISAEYGVLSSEGFSYRATFILDQHKLVRHQTINDLPLGRNVDEILRILDALNHVEQHGEVCPANWKKGEPGMNPTTAGVAKYLASNADKL